ncbi:MAG: DUF3516 domain-containing protein, partial [Brevundimonas sp.]
SLTDPSKVAEAAARAAANEPEPPARPITANERAFAVMVRNAMFQKVQLAARDRFDALADAELAAATLSGPLERPTMDAVAWEEALGAYWEEHESLDAGPDARSPELLLIDKPGAGEPRVWTVRQVINDPEGNRDWSILATIDLDVSDDAGEPVIRTQSFGTGAL